MKSHLACLKPSTRRAVNSERPLNSRETLHLESFAAQSICLLLLREHKATSQGIPVGTQHPNLLCNTKGLEQQPKSGTGIR